MRGISIRPSTNREKYRILREKRIKQGIEDRKRIGERGVDMSTPRFSISSVDSYLEGRRKASRKETTSKFFINIQKPRPQVRLKLITLNDLLLAIQEKERKDKEWIEEEKKIMEEE